MAGPVVRTDIVDVYVFRRPAGRTGNVQFLQLRRSVGPLAGTWQPVMGHVRPRETAVRAAVRELAEETGYRPGAGLVALWQLEQVNAFFMARRDCVMLCPCFAAEVAPASRAQGPGAGLPRLNAEHDSFRWLSASAAAGAFLWPGQRAALEQIRRDILRPGSRVADLLRLELPAIRDSAR